MTWTNDHQQRLNHLRKQELVGTLADFERTELEALMLEIESEEARTLAPSMQHLRADLLEQEREIAAVHAQNEEQARLLARQEALAADARRLLADVVASD